MLGKGAGGGDGDEEEYQLRITATPPTTRVGGEENMNTEKNNVDKEQEEVIVMRKNTINWKFGNSLGHHDMLLLWEVGG